MEDGVRADTAIEYVIPRKGFPVTFPPCGRTAMCRPRLRDLEMKGSWADAEPLRRSATVTQRKLAGSGDT